MTRRPQGHWRIAALLGFLALVILAVPPPSTGRPPSTSEPIITWTAYPSIDRSRPTRPPPPIRASPEAGASASNVPSPTARAIATHWPTATAASMSGHSITGIASWYCRPGVSRCTRGHPGGMYAAIRRDLLFLRGKVVTVCASRCIEVTIIDCNCGPNANLIDLYSDAFRELAPLSRGVVKVTVRWRTSP